MKTASSLSWRPIGELPEECLEQVRSDATLEVRRDGKPRSDRHWQLLLIPGVAGLIAGVMAGLLIPSGPWPSLLRLAVLVAGAVSFAVWLAWYRGRSERPLAGQGVLLTPSTLVVVDHTSVAIVRAEHVDVDQGNLLIAKELVHRVDEIFLDQLARAKEADLDTRKADPWRSLAGAADGRPIPTPRSRPLGRPALLGFGAALALELLFALAIGWPAAASRDESWGHSEQLLAGQLDQIDRYQDRAFVEQLSDADGLMGMRHLVVQALELGDGSERATRVLRRYRTMLSERLAATRSSNELIDEVMTVTGDLAMPDDVTAVMRARLAALVLEETARSDDPERLMVGLRTLVAHEVEGQPVEVVRARLAAMTDTIVAAADLDRAAHLYDQSAGILPPEHPLRAGLLARVHELVAAELPAVTDGRALYLRFSSVRRLVPDERVTDLIDGRFEELVREQVATLRDTSQLLEYYQLHLNREFNQFLTARYEDLAREEIRRAVQVEQIDHFRQEFETLGVSDELTALLGARLAALERR